MVRQILLDHRGMLLADVPVRTGSEVVGLTAGETFAGGSTSGATEACDLVVGADRIRSSVRDLALGGSPVGSLGQVCWRHGLDGFADITNSTVRFGHGRAFLTVPLGNTQTHRRDRTRGLSALIRNLTMRPAAERIVGTNSVEQA